MFVLVNSVGMLLGVYSTREIAALALKIYEKEDAVSGEPVLYLYRVDQAQMDIAIANRYECVWTNDF